MLTLNFVYLFNTVRKSMRLQYDKIMRSKKSINKPIVGENRDFEVRLGV